MPIWRFDLGSIWPFWCLSPRPDLALSRFFCEQDRIKPQQTPSAARTRNQLPFALGSYTGPTRGRRFTHDGHHREPGRAHSGDSAVLLRVGDMPAIAIAIAIAVAVLNPRYRQTVAFPVNKRHNGTD